MFDVIIVGGRVINGTGSPWFRADIGIRDGKIQAIGQLDRTQAEQIIDAEDRMVAPGFIDIHSHSDFNLLINPLAESKVRQGVTTEVIGQCGNSAAPLARERLEMMKKEWGVEGADEISWEDMSQYLDLLEERNLAVNCVALVGHGNVRRQAMGEGDRPPTAEELDKMKEILRDALEAGAFGMSTGLIYPPGVYSATEELVELAKVLGDHGGIYFTHLRNEGDQHARSLEEAIQIGREGGCPVQISHLKVVGEANWGRAQDALDILEQARRDGLDVTADQYPYVATSTGLTARLPAWAHDGGREKMLARLGDDETRVRMKEEMAADGGWDQLMVSRVSSEENRQYEGMSIADIAAERGTDPEDTIFDLLLEEDGNVGSVRFGMSEEDVKTIMESRLVMTGSDGSALAPHGMLGRGKPHPRSYGTFPRVLGKYAREEGVFTVEEAVARMTSRPAARMGLWDRGLLLPGFCADVVVFDETRVRDVATFTEPHQFPRGIDYVLVNGVVAVDDQGQRDVLPGKVLRRE